MARLLANEGKGNCTMTKKWVGVLDGADDVINRHISHDGYNFRHGKVGKALSASPKGFSARLLLKELIDTVEGNLRTKRESAGIQFGASKSNWREESPKEQHLTRKSERDLEHKIANIAGLSDRNWTWWNQMPIASGLVEHRSDRTRAIDLACRSKSDSTHYRLIELKVNRNAGSPMFAMIEILLYGLVYFVLRKNRGERWLLEDWLNADIFAAKLIDLCVLAPGDYYDGYELGWLESELSQALGNACTENFGGDLSMTLTNYRLAEISKWSKVSLDYEKTLQGLATTWEIAYKH